MDFYRVWQNFLRMSLLILSLNCFADSPQPKIVQYNPADYRTHMVQYFRHAVGHRQMDLQQRIINASYYFLGKPYVLGALGEGPQANIDQEPLYRTDAFDCTTYVSTVLAMAHAKNIHEFEQLIKRIRYHNAIVSFAKRNHFTSVDWNFNNNFQGYVRDVTYKIHDKNGKPLAKTAITIIDKPRWFRHFNASAITHRSVLTQEEVQKKLQQLHAIAKQTQQEKAVTLYIPLTALFNKKGKADMFVFHQIMSGSIVEIVRPNWHLKNKIGTNLNISHLGFAIRTKEGLMYREASATAKKIIDISLIQYLKPYLKSRTVKGISVLATS